ncbi:MAG: YihY/virulence factor BrkB family protein [Bacilli bacterium]|nr:YihY/virulence factor BrkB family protein [Bacilli bacterium]
MKRRIKALYKRLIKNIRKPEMLILPGQLSFFFLMTIVPLGALFISIFSRLHITTDFIGDLIINNVPKALIGIIDTLSIGARANTNAIIFFISALVLASNGTHSMIIASNKLYNIKDKDYIGRRAKSILMMLVLIGLLLFIFLVPVFGDMIIKMVQSVSNQNIGNIVKNIYNILKYPISFALVFAAIKLLYIMAPDIKIKSKEVNYGAIFTSFSWVLVTQIYSIYVENFSNYTNLYGSLSNILVLMWWVYILSYIFVLGIGLNVTKYQLTKE